MKGVIKNKIMLALILSLLVLLSGLLMLFSGNFDKNGGFGKTAKADGGARLDCHLQSCVMAFRWEDLSEKNIE